MAGPKESEREVRETESAQAREKEGHGLVPNVPADPAEDKKGELKEALHELEEEKGDWGKDH